MIEGALAVLLPVVLVGLFIYTLDGGFKSRSRCIEECCRALRSTCSDGRCKFHCNLYCKCVPRGDSRPLTVVKGGRK